MAENRKEIISKIEGLNNLEGETPNDLNWWRKVLYRHKIELEEIREIEHVRDSIIEKYDSEIKKRRENIEFSRNLIETNIKGTKFRTKTGGYKIDQFPDIGTLSLSKERVNYVVNKEDCFLEKGFSRVIPERIEIDKKALNKYLDTCHIEGEYLVDKETGEVIEGVSISKSRTFCFK